MSPSPAVNKTILIADDDMDVLHILRGLLRNKPVKIIEATDGDEAMEKVLEHHPDLVILDVMMPGQSGWEVCRNIREHASTKDTRVIMLTGIGANMNEMTSPLYGADAHMDKPFDVKALSNLIDQQLA